MCKNVVSQQVTVRNVLRSEDRYFVAVIGAKFVEFSFTKFSIDPFGALTS